MSKKLQLSIPTPCHENWDNMTPVQQGKFCGSCQKQVIDFSNMSDRQVAEFFKKPSTGSVCGRFMQDQLDRNIEIPKKRIPWLKYFFQFLLPAFLISVKATAQGKVKITKISNVVQKPTCSKTVGMTVPILFSDNKKTLAGDTAIPLQSQKIKGDIKFPVINDPVLIKGKVINENGESVPFATIMIKGTKTGTAAQADGEFSLKPVNDWESVVLAVSCVGFESKEMLIEKKRYKPGITFILKDSEITLSGEVVIVANVNHVVGRLITGAYSVCRKETIIDKAKKWIMPAKDSIKVYPNPVQTGASLNIEWKQSETGAYLLQLLNQTGQLTFTKEMYIDDEARILNLQLPSVAAGNYFLRMTNKKSGKSYTEKIIIQ
jgi:CarboxypepD_reg-like domain/Secretion system C-terminal sorting domain